MPKESLVPFCSPPASLSAGLQHQGDSLADSSLVRIGLAFGKKSCPGLCPGAF